jgi:hypothetical protein
VTRVLTTINHKKSKRMHAYRVEHLGECQALYCTNHAHFLRLVDAQGLDHILYYPPNQHVPRFAVYLALNHNTFLVHCIRGAVSTSELAALHHWVTQHRQRHAYAFLRCSVIAPARNESHSTHATIGQWCDTQIDAFVLFQCKQLLDRTKRKTGAKRPLHWDTHDDVKHPKSASPVPMPTGPAVLCE